MSYLAQFDILKLRYAPDSENMREFNEAVPVVNKLAEESEGFIWRQKEVDDVALSALWGEGYIYTISVWRDAACLKKFLFETQHGCFMKKGRKWFDNQFFPRHVLWHIPEGHFPTLREAHSKLMKLMEKGPSATAFDLRSTELPITGY